MRLAYRIAINSRNHDSIVISRGLHEVKFNWVNVEVLRAIRSARDRLFSSTRLSGPFSLFNYHVVRCWATSDRRVSKRSVYQGSYTPTQYVDTIFNYTRETDNLLFRCVVQQHSYKRCRPPAWVLMQNRWTQGGSNPVLLERELITGQSGGLM